MDTKPQVFVAMILDITERKLAEEESRESESRYKDLFESASDVIVMVTSEGDIVDINRRAEELTGFSRDELLRSNVLRELIIPEDRATIERVLSHLYEGENQMYEVRWRAKNGTVIAFEGSSTPRQSPDGEFLTTRCILRDITERKQAELELETTMNQLTLARNSLLAMLAVSASCLASVS